ncbi:MAG: ethylbenzene dehydrogenase-related protein [Thiohalocapsa sp.]
MQSRQAPSHDLGRGALAAALWSALSTAPILAADPNALEVKPGETIPLAIVPAQVSLRVSDDPQDMLWERVPEYQVQLLPAPSVHDSVKLRQAQAGPSIPLYFSVASDRKRLYIKLRWVDQTRDQETLTDRFRDGAAVQMALKAGDATSYMMGSADMPVNIWYWRSDSDRAENLGVGGFGSTTTLPVQPVSVQSHYHTARMPQDNQWTLVMSRPLEQEGEYTARFEPGSVQPLAFAVWQGADQQRDGLKRTSPGWINVDLSPLKGS